MKSALGADMRFWWVNHKQTFSQESKGGYLWSPKKRATGVRSQFYDNMHLAREGDAVISYAGARVRAVGQVESEAVTAAKPTTFGSTGANWSAYGWLLPVTWRSVKVEIRPMDFLGEISAFLPSKYSPLNPASGYGNQAAYLSEVSHSLFEKILELTQGVGEISNEACDANTILAVHTEEQVSKIFEDLALSDTERRNVIAARWGQGIFRKALLNLDRACAITGITDPRLLRASHIQPWRVCETAEQRLSPSNGLLLTPTFDHLFDKGMMTFDRQGNAIFSSTLSDNDLKLLFQMRCRSGYSLEHHEKYLDFHRSEVFIS